VFVVGGVGVGVGLKLTSRGGPDVERGAADAVTLLAPAAEIEAGAPVTFTWQPVSGAHHYELETSKVVFALATEQTSATLDDARRLAPGATYRWWVRATTGAGDQRASRVRSRRLRMK
jgi:hypothetical protein